MDFLTYWENRMLFLCFQLSNTLQKGEAEAGRLAGQIIGKSDRTILCAAIEVLTNVETIVKLHVVNLLEQMQL